MFGTRFFTKMEYRKEIFFILLSSLFILGYLATRPFLFFVHDSSMLLAVPAPPQAAFSLWFIHSVQKTPVRENLIVNETGDGFVLKSTKYQSFGVGLPFLLNEGKFKQEGDYFIFEDMNRPLKALTLRTGVGTQLTLIYNGVRYPVYQKLLPGAAIDLKIEPYYMRILYNIML